MKLYLFELTGRSLLAFVNPEDLMDSKTKETFEVEEMEYLTIYNPAMLSMSAVQGSPNIAVPNQQNAISLVPVVMPYYVDRMILFIANVMGLYEIPKDHLMQEEMKNIVQYHEQSSKPKPGGFKPKIVS